MESRTGAVNVQQDLLARLAKLEQDWGIEKARHAPDSLTMHPPLPPPTSGLALSRVESLTPLQLNQEVRTTSPIQNKSQAGSPQVNAGHVQSGSFQSRPTIAVQVSQPTPGTELAATGRCFFEDRHAIPLCCAKDLRLFSTTNSVLETSMIRQKVQTFFDLLNPHSDPCLNQNQVLAQLKDDTTAGLQPGADVDKVQYIALIHLVLALVAILEESCTRADYLPGWTRCQQGSHLLAHALWISGGNFLTIQCLQIKATYLLYAEKLNASYEAVGQAVRLCYLTGLNRPRSNVNDMSPFQEHMRRRTFWALYCLERNISLVCGVPYLIRDSEIQVPLQDMVDEQVLLDTEQLPDESAMRSFMPYLCSTVRWARLSSEVWDHLFCANASRPAEDDFIVSIDARIVNLREALPAHLQWRHRNQTQPWEMTSPEYINRQAMILHLRTNHLRLQLRREGLLTSDFRLRDHRTCLSIAKDTVDTIYDFYFSTASGPIQRYSCVAYTTAALIVLAGILLGPRPDEEVLLESSLAFRRALRVLQHIAPGLSIARRTLKKLDHIIAAFERSMSVSEETAPPSKQPETWLAEQLSQPSGNEIEYQNLPLDVPEQGNVDFGVIDDGFLRMAYTPAFDAHYWDVQLFDLQQHVGV